MPRTGSDRVKANNSTLTTALVANEKATSLSLQSTNKEIKKYFTAVLALAKTNDKFPVNLDEVYPLVYAQKGHALRELKSKFIEGVDYYLSQNGKVVTDNDLVNGIKYDCFLSLPCLEFFIARKVRPVFDVYREVFHKTSESLPKMAKTYKEYEAQITLLKEELEETQMRMNLYRSISESEKRLKNSCFSFLVQKRQYKDWEKFDEERRKEEIMKRITSLK